MYILFKLSQYVKVMGIFVKFGYFYDARSPSMVMSLDPKSKFLFFLNSKFLVEKLSTFEVVRQKPLQCL